MRLAILLVCVTLGLAQPAAAAETYTEAEIAAAGAATQQAKQAYWDCLAQEANSLPVTTSTADMRAFLEGACWPERSNFRVPFVDYLAMQFPEVPFEQLMRSFDETATAAIAAEVARFIRLKAR